MIMISSQNLSRADLELRWAYFILESTLSLQSERNFCPIAQGTKISLFNSQSKNVEIECEVRMWKYVETDLVIKINSLQGWPDRHTHFQMHT